MRFVRRQSGWRVACIEIALGCALTLVAFTWLRGGELANERAELDARLAQATYAVESTMREATATVNALAAFIGSAVETAEVNSGVADLSPVAFDNFADAVLQHVRGIQALSWAVPVRRDDLAELERRMAAAGFLQFHVKERDAEGQDVPVRPRPSYTPVLMIYPLEGNAPAQGFDLASRADRRAALDMARRVGGPVMTQRLNLVQDRTSQFGTIVFQPVFSSAGDFRGYATGVLRIGELLEGRLVDRSDAVKIALFDSSAPEDQQLLYPTGLAASAAALRAAGGAAQTIALAGRSWTVIAYRDGGMGAGWTTWRSTLALVFGLFVTLTIVAFHIVVSGGRATVERQVKERTLALNHAMAELKTSQSQFRDFLNTASDWYWETDAQYRFTFKSEGAASNAAHAAALIGLDRMTEDDPEMEIAPRRAMLDKQRPFHGLRCIVTTEEGQAALTIDGVPVFDGNGNFTGYRGSARDTTAAAKAEAAERSARVAAEAANRSKSAFLANMSHEIRTPMNGLIGMAQILRHSGLDEQQKHSVNIIVRSAENLLTVLNDILDYSKLEVGSIAIERIPCNLPDLVNEVASLVRQGAEEKGVPLLCEMPATPPPLVMGDPVRMRQILLNLATNAIKFTFEGSIRIALRYEVRPPGRVVVHMSVSDTGIGMDRTTVSRLFTRFMQADASSTRRFGGTGLGLSIAQELAGLMQGEVTVESQLGQGSTFTLRLTLDCAATQDVAEPAVVAEPAIGGAQRRLRILAAEDDEINRLVLGGFIEPYGHELTLAHDGAQVVERLLEGEFDVILMDVMMPGTDGLQATRMIRALPGPKSRTPIIALTANAMAGDRETYLEVGMDDYVSKPISRPALYRAIEELLQCRAFAKVVVERKPQPRSGPQAPARAADEQVDAFLAALDLDMPMEG